MIAHRPGKRAVVRVASDRSPPGYVKLGSVRATARAAARATTIADLLAGTGDGPTLAPVVDVDRHAGELTLGALAGESLTASLVDRDDASARRIGSVIGRMLCVLAVTAPAGLAEHTVADEVAVLDRWVADALRYGALAGDAADRLRRRRDDVVERLLGLHAPSHVLAHRDLHDGQIVVAADPGAGIGVLDWDTACAAAPGLDVGNLLAHLDRLARHAPAARAAASGVEAGAREGGHPAVVDGAVDGPEAVEVWRAAAAVRMAAVHAFRP